MISWSSSPACSRAARTRPGACGSASPAPSSSKSRFVVRLVSGVRSSWDASATSWRCAVSDSCSAASMVSKDEAEPAHLIVGPGEVEAGGEVAGLGDVLGGRGELGDGPQDAARGQPRRAVGEAGGRDGERGEEQGRVRSAPSSAFAPGWCAPAHRRGEGRRRCRPGTADRRRARRRSTRAALARLPRHRGCRAARTEWADRPTGPGNSWISTLPTVTGSPKSGGDRLPVADCLMRWATLEACCAAAMRVASTRDCRLAA